ncbi:MAG: PDZ domain-containing protein [Bacteroidetes bacterium]|nr:PDZ domain-containing protein [Bacteroidota bacterium]
MKSGITRLLALTLAICLGFNLSLIAQSEQTDQTEVVIVQKIIEDDGTETIVKKRVYAGDDAKSYLHENKDELSAMWEGNEEEGVEHYMIIRRDDEGRKKEVVIQMDGAQERNEWKEKHKEHKYEYHYNHQKSQSNKAFMGVYPEQNPLGEGVILDGIVNNSGAQEAGLLTGDVMTSINDFPLVRHSDLSKALAQHEPGESITVTYLRNGETMQTNVVLTQRGDYAKMERDPCQVFIGVSLSRQRAVEGKGIRVSNVISGTSAETYGVMDGDVIVRLDDVAVNTFDELLIERNKHQPGDWYTLTVLRNETEQDIDLQFTLCDEPKEEVEEIEDPIEEEVNDDVDIEDDILDVQEPQFDGTLDLVEFKAFPNPTFGNLQVTFRADAVPTQIRITDIAGKVVFQDNVQQFDGFYNKEVNLSDVAPGTLILTVSQEGRVLSEKVVLLPRA